MKTNYKLKNDYLVEKLKKRNLLDFYETSDEVIEFLQPSIRAICAKYVCPELSYEDLKATCELRVLTDLNKFNPNSGVQINTFMFSRLIDACQNLKTSMSKAYRVSNTNVKIYAKIKVCEEEGMLDNEICDKFKISMSRLIRLRENNKMGISFETNISDNSNETTLKNLVASNEDFLSDMIKNQSQERLRFILRDVLSERDYNITKLFYGIDCEKMTYQDIGDLVGLCGERIRQITRNSLLKLRESVYRKELLELLSNLS